MLLAELSLNNLFPTATEAKENKDADKKVEGNKEPQFDADKLARVSIFLGLQPALKGARPVVVWPQCIKLLYEMSFILWKLNWYNYILCAAVKSNWKPSV